MRELLAELALGLFLTPFGYLLGRYGVKVAHRCSQAQLRLPRIEWQGKGSWRNLDADRAAMRELARRFNPCKRCGKPAPHRSGLCFHCLTATGHVPTGFGYWHCSHCGKWHSNPDKLCPGHQSYRCDVFRTEHDTPGWLRRGRCTKRYKHVGDHDFDFVERFRNGLSRNVDDDMHAYLIEITGGRK